MESAIVPKIYDRAVADADLVVRTEDAYRMAKRLAREEAMLVSPSAAAALVGCFQVAASLGPDAHAVIVTIFPDAAEKYLSERFWDEI
jgi:cysteine synthase B